MKINIMLSFVFFMNVFSLYSMQSDFALHEAARMGDLNGISQYLAQSKDAKAIDALNATGHTPLMIAVIAGKLKTVKALVTQHNASLTMAGPLGQTALHFAAHDGSSRARGKIAHFLMVQAAQVDALDATNSMGMTALHEAVIRGQNTIAKALVSFGADKEANDNANNTPLDYAKAKKNEDMIACLTAAIEATPLMFRKEVHDAQEKDSPATAALSRTNMLMELRRAQKELAGNEDSQEDSE
ncbi:MAG: ankyrin repeat domain-containing protein [Candidatus Babeliales bacterium]